MSETLETIVFCGQQPGLKLLVLGAVHGNEHCGPNGIAQIVSSLEKGDLALQAGAVTFVPVCNPVAHAANQRMIAENLNRIITPHDLPTCPEHHYANQLCALIAAHDAVLDLHSYHNGTEPYLYLDKDDVAHRAYAQSLPFAWWVTGWDNLYADQADLNQGDTIAYVHQLGKIGILVECGRHDWEGGADLAAQSIRGALSHFGLTAQKTPVTPDIKIIHQYALCRRQPGAQFTQDWQHLDFVTTGTVLSMLPDGASSDIAPSDSYLVIPFKEAAEGKEWLYLGELT